MRDILEDMIYIYQSKDIDWMGFKVTEDNPYTYHHIVEKRDGGKYDIENGAILTKKAHEYLNYLDLYSPEAYGEYQKMFRYINAINGPISDDVYEDIYYLAYEVECLHKYVFNSEPRNPRKEKKEKRALQQKQKSKDRNKPKRR